MNTSTGGVLLVTGPSGCGKTATVQVLSKELNARVQEWSNPVNMEQISQQDWQLNGMSGFQSYQGSQIQQFQDFLLRANKYSCLQMSGEGRPRSGRSSWWRRFVRTSRVPLVFIMSDSVSADSSSRHLFPREIQDELHVTHIRRCSRRVRRSDHSTAGAQSASSPVQHHREPLLVEPETRSLLSDYSSSVATRGLLHSNSQQASVGFRPLHKPHWIHVHKKYRGNCLAAQTLFRTFCLTPVGLQTELLPYLAKLSNPMRNQGPLFPHLTLKPVLKLEAVADKELGQLPEDSEEEEEPAKSEAGLPDSQQSLPDSQNQPSTAQDLLQPEETLIEEYDSD
ncbi:hypothetical protein WMY93_012593 [Mugilogobius chulae]|uniref:AAA+ ATPase domain-containing protein n=1 Tax=Mugilogobius chulae TaxID=88201 RepID=A0AAW0P7N5_9GOBI